MYLLRKKSIIVTYARMGMCVYAYAHVRKDLYIENTTWNALFYAQENTVHFMC